MRNRVKMVLSLAVTALATSVFAIHDRNVAHVMRVHQVVERLEIVGRTEREHAIGHEIAHFSRARRGFGVWLHGELLSRGLRFLLRSAAKHHGASLFPPRSRGLMPMHQVVGDALAKNQDR